MKLLVAVALLAAAACGSKSPTATTPKPGEGSAAAALPDVPFDKLDQHQRLELMKQKVFPTMKAVFQNHNAKAFAEFGCETCHGDGAKEGHFDMPNPKLPKLNFKDLSQFKKEDLEWMEKEVEPTMAKLLGVPVYTKDNPTGFGCPACHPIEQ